jgi:hypothetical protein
MRASTAKHSAPFSIVYRATDPQTGRTKQVSRWDWESKEAGSRPQGRATDDVRST